MTIECSVSSQEALQIANRLHKKFKETDYERASKGQDEVKLSRMELDELVGGLEKLKERLTWVV